MKICILLILACTVTYTLCQQKDTHDPEFETQFQVKHLKEGDGKSFAKVGDRVSVHYTGTFPHNGKKFDSSKDRNTPFGFTLKRGQVIQCWDEVVSRMSIGEAITVICPAKLAYGERGAGGVIPPNADIAFEIEMLGFTAGKEDF
jgi:FK506-binding protein 1